ncbi:MAG: hypothetical protein M3307_03580 [Thermoproteota archaeon]|nr:hypothetical protein [Thermoproteota archaeon]
MRSRRYGLDFSKKLFLAATLAILSMLSLGMLPNEALAAPDKFGIEQLYPSEDGEPVWFLNSEDPEADDNFLMTSANDIDLEEEDSDVFELDAETGTQKHGVRIHADSPDDDWKNVEMTGYFKLEEGEDQFTLVARQGPTYNDDGGCGAYGYYGMLSADGDAFFKKKLFHHGGYTDRTAVEENVVEDLHDRWIGLKLVVYDLNEDEVKLELWVDDGNEENNWRKVTEYVDDGNWETNGSDCDRDGDETIDEGTRGGFRVDDSAFEFKKLSIREIDAGQGPEIAAEEGEEGDAIEETEVDGEETQGGGERLDEIEALASLKQLAEMADITDVEELEEIAQVEELGELEEVTDVEELEEIVRAPDLEGLAELVGASDTEDLLELVIP